MTPEAQPWADFEQSAFLSEADRLQLVTALLRGTSLLARPQPDTEQLAHFLWWCHLVLVNYGTLCLVLDGKLVAYWPDPPDPGGHPHFYPPAKAAELRP